MSNSLGDRSIVSQPSEVTDVATSLPGIDRLDLLSSTSLNRPAVPETENQDFLAFGNTNIYQSVLEQNENLASERLPSSTLPKEPVLIADVVIHSGAPDQVRGHQSIEITNSIIGRMNYSFATDNGLAPSFGTGQVYFDEAGLNGPEERRYRLTPEQDRMVLEYLNSRRSDWDGSRYSLSNRNCRTFVNEIEQFVRQLPQR